MITALLRKSTLKYLCGIYLEEQSIMDRHVPLFEGIVQMKTVN